MVSEGKTRPETAFHLIQLQLLAKANGLPFLKIKWPPHLCFACRFHATGKKRSEAAKVINYSFQSWRVRR